MLDVLVFVSAYLPGYKGGGHIRTVANMAERLGDELRFHVVTRDRDFGDECPYPGLTTDAWHRVGRATVRYLSPQQASFPAIAELMRGTRWDVLYLNSLFHPVFTLRPLALRRAGRVPRRPVIVAPRGELAAGALSLKAHKKRCFLLLARAIGLYRDVIWQASNAAEAVDVRRVFGPQAMIEISRDLSPAASAGPAESRPPKQPGSLRLLFLSRIAPAKNLARGIEMLRDVEGRIDLEIYGLVDDAAYWSECQRVQATLPPNVRVHYHGPVPHEQVSGIMGRHHVFYLPTLGENFGHAIQEALLAGCPVLISDRTMWRELASRRAGWDLPLESPERFREVLGECVAMDQHTLAGWSAGARRLGLESTRDGEVVEENRALFRRAVAGAA